MQERRDPADIRRLIAVAIAESYKGKELRESVPDIHNDANLAGTQATTPSVVVSVVVPTRNRRDKIARCLKGLAGQSQQGFEVLVIDDGSADETVDFLADYKMPRDDVLLRTFRNDLAQGANPSRNLGIRESRGEFVAFLDDDCIPDPPWLECLVAAFESDAVAAVTGHVDNVEPRNIFELTLKGAHRVHGKRFATRLVAGNLCVRRECLRHFYWDEDRAAPAKDMSVSGRGDEEGLFLTLRAAGYTQLVARDARVVHDHPHNASSFFKQAYRSGVSTAKLGYKYRLPPRVELVPLLVAYLTLPLGFRAPFGWLLPAACFGFFLAAILYNDLWRKRKSVFETLRTLPWLLAFFHARLAGYVVESIRIRARPGQVQRVRLKTRVAKKLEA